MINNCDFSLRHYFAVLDNARSNYNFIGSLRDLYDKKERKSFIILRHDVDISLEHALKIAKMESDHDLHSTFFILLHSQFYNALTKKNISIIRKISELGHEIGLHYDTSVLPKSFTSARLQLKNEVKILEDISDQKIISVTQHNPTTSTKLNLKLVSGFLDAMHNPLTKSSSYISDSVQNWRKGCMCNHVGLIPKLQILTHPIWWHEVSVTRDKILHKIKEYQKTDVDSEFKTLDKLYNTYLQNVQNNSN